LVREGVGGEQAGLDGQGRGLSSGDGGSVAAGGQFGLLLARLRARLPDLENKVYAAVRQVGTETELTERTDYLAGTRALVAASLAFCLNVLERGPIERVPEAVVAQGRRAARLGVSAETLAMRLAAGKQVVIWEVEGMVAAQEVPLTAEELRRFQEDVERVGAQIISAVLEEYSAERLRQVSPQEQRQLEVVRALLSGVAVPPEERAVLGYDLEGRHHLGVVAIGESGRGELIAAGARLGVDVLALTIRPGQSWGWFGAGRALPIGPLIEALDQGEARFAIGQPQSELAGFRLSHEQARSAARVVERMGEGAPKVVRWADVAICAALLERPALARSLVAELLGPLDGLRISGKEARETLRAYFACGSNGASAAKLLGVDRRTVAYRLREIESRLGRQLSNCAAQLQAALALEELGVTAG
jgi:hypothetical protein